MDRIELLLLKGECFHSCCTHETSFYAAVFLRRKRAIMGREKPKNSSIRFVVVIS